MNKCYFISVQYNISLRNKLPVYAATQVNLKRHVGKEKDRKDYMLCDSIYMKF